MNPDNPKWREIPFLCELHAQWFANRGSATDDQTFQRPFSRKWEDLLKDADLIFAEQHKEADREARMLEQTGLLKLKMVRFRPYIERVSIPLEAEPRLRKLFPEFQVHTDNNFDWNAIEWEPEMRSIAEARVTTNSEDLVRLNNFLKNGGRDFPIVPIKERSLQIFGDEKRLDGMRASALFRPDRLDLKMFRCEVVGEPFGWKRGLKDTGRVLVIENAATWHSYCRWNAERHLFSAVVYGCGNRFIESIHFLADILAEFSTPQQIIYFGDLDPQGLRIPIEASAKATRLGMPPVTADLWSYRHLLTLGAGKETPYDAADPLDPANLAWLGELAAQVQALLDSEKRLAQEHVGWEFLRTQAIQG
jgi:hypothetical protein